MSLREEFKIIVGTEEDHAHFAAKNKAAVLEFLEQFLDKMGKSQIIIHLVDNEGEEWKS